MLSDITIGQYFPGNSALHRMDPRVKIGLLFLMIISIFAFSSPSGYAVLGILALALAASSGIPLKMMLRSLRPLLFILAFTFLIHLFSTPGRVIATVWAFEATYEGLARGGFLCARLILLIFFSSLLTFTTSPLELTDGLEKLMRPLKCAGVPAHELAMMMTIALRFVPTLVEETDKIMKAQEARGSDFSSGSFLHRIKALIPVLVPLFISSFRRADELALAMEARGYRGGEGRTRMRELRLKAVDYAAVAAALVIIAASGAMSIAGI